MIISPPFLPDGDVDQSTADETWVGTMMPHTGDGKFPVSDYFQWHGGVHLVAPEGNNKTKVPVRAIADGKILYVRQPTPEPDNKAGTVPHPQNHQGQEDWCDNGCVVIQHDTEIGEDLPVTFYSIYMHLKSIEATVIKGSDIHRKGKIGQAGQIYGIDGQIHFEIIADEANTKKFIGDLAFTAPSYHTNQYGCEQAFRAQNGRTDACFGSMYFYIPQGASIYEESIVEEDKVVPVKNKRTGKVSSKTIKVKKTVCLPKQQDNGTDLTVGQNIYVEMAFDKGKCTFTSYDEDGNPLVGDPVVTKGDSSYSDVVHEYNLYKASLALYPSKPTAGFELLRFGRVIGDEDFAEPATVTHFREIQTAKGKYWVDLNKSYIKKYSDADFPYWKGWGVVSDDNDGDGRCDSLIIGSILYSRTQQIKNDISSIPSGFGKQTPKDYQDGINSDMAQQSAMQYDDVKKKLQKLFYKFPTEWSMDQFDERYAWVKEDHFANDDKKFANFKAHVQSLAFWDEAGIPIDKNHWHFPPIEFIKHFRKCSWLSKYEIKQLVPSGISKKFIIENIQVNLNKMFRKYCINTPMRMVSFFGNSIEETAYLTAPQENTHYSAASRPWYIPDWCGRGLLHLTHAYNYCDYFVFCGETISPVFQTFVDRYTAIDHQGRQYKLNHRSEVEDAQHPDLQYYFDLRDKVAVPTLKNCSDSAGFYWTRSNISKMADEEHQLELFGTKDYSSQAFGKTAAAVNNPSAHAARVNYNSINGFPVRCNIYKVCLYVLTEIKFPDGHGGKIEQPRNYTARGNHEDVTK